MAREVASIFLAVDLTKWDVESNHHRCICHVIALILGAGLKALRISKLMLWSKKADQSFPALATVVEVDEPTEEITKVIKESDEEDIDPDDAAAGSPEADDNENNDEDSSRGIGLTLKKAS
ncbi:hypothetical protein PtB15_10B675 [Puccinia triticina]|nr:hypothetical protein PtB15_10B675 [Puccinia triticina]